MSEKQLSRKELVSCLDNQWSASTTAYQEKAYQQIKSLIEQRLEKKDIAKRLLNLNQLIKNVNALSPKNQQEFYRICASKLEQKPVSREFVERWEMKFPIDGLYDKVRNERVITEMLTELGHEVSK